MTVSHRLALIAFALAVHAAPPAAAQDAARGAQIYMSTCQACHGYPPAGGPDRAAGNPSMIRNAINFRVPAMGFLRPVLSDADLADIALWLQNPVLGPPPPPPVPATPLHDFTDLWYNPQESGWGLNLIQHSGSNAVFGVFYTYDTTRRPLWLVMPGGRWNTGLQYEGDVYRTTGPRFNQEAFDATRVDLKKVGTFLLDFSGRDAGTFIYTVDGVTLSRAIARQPF